MTDNRKVQKLLYYTRGVLRHLTPRYCYQRRLPALLRGLDDHPDAEYIRQRVDFYNKLTRPFVVNSPPLGEFRDTKRSFYYFDAIRYFKYFPRHFRLDYLFGDVIHVPDVPTVLKCRPIAGNNENSVLMKFNAFRHFRFVNDPLRFEQKKNLLVWRGAANRQHRLDVVKAFHDHPLCDVGQTNNPPQDVPWQKLYLSIAQQLTHKFILCIEGCELATSLKWILSSNSLCFMVRPRFESWFMEAQLVPGRHYVVLRDDYADLPEKIEYYARHTDEALAIIGQAHEHVNQFRDSRREDLISLLVLKKYFDYSSQPLAA